MWDMGIGGEGAGALFCHTRNTCADNLIAFVS